MTKTTMLKRISRPQLIFLRLRKCDPAQVFRGLRWLANSKGFQLGWVSHKFKEIFDRWPDFEETGSCEAPSEDLVSWLAHGRRKFRGKMRAANTRNAAAAAKALDRIEAIVSEIEAIDRASGGIHRDPGDWEPLCIVERIEKKMIANGAAMPVQRTESIGP